MSALGDLVRDFAIGRRNFRVGRGECSDLVIQALQVAGGRSSFPSQHGSTVWGTPIPLASAEPGDILQMRNYRVVIRNIDNTGFIENRGHPHHSAIVIRNLGNGVLQVAEQNMVYQGADPASVRTVGIATLYVTNQVTSDRRTITVRGEIWAYRPQAQ